MGLAIEGEHVMLAETVQLDVLHDDHLAHFLMELGGFQYRTGIYLVSLCHVLHGLGHTLGLIGLNLQGFSSLNIAEAAASGTDIPENHKSSRISRITLRTVRA